MGQDGVAVDQLVGQFAVKAGQVMEQLILVIIDELLLDSTIEALGAGVYFVRILPDTNPLRGLRAISLPAKWWANGDKSASGSCGPGQGVAGSLP